MKRNIFLVFTILAIFVCGLQLTEPAAAAKAKLIDKGSDVSYDNTTNSTLKVIWKTYQYNKNYIVIKTKYYKNGKLMNIHSSTTITKYSKKIVKIVYLTQGRYKNEDNLNSYVYSKNKEYRKYSSTARNYYFYKLAYVSNGAF